VHEDPLSLSQAITVSVDLARIRSNAEAIRLKTGVPIIAVVKADAYGLGASAVAETIGDLVEAFYVFDAAEAVQARLWEITGRRTIALNSAWNDPGDFLSCHIQPVVWSVDRAQRLRQARPIVSVDTGQQRFSAAGDIAEQVCRAGDCNEAMTHAISLDQVNELLNVVSGWPDRHLFLHAAGSALLNQPRAWLNAVRPGLALYQGAARVSAPLVEVRDSNRAAGYTGFLLPRFGIILAGYFHGIRRGPCMVNGVLRQVIEVGMQSAFVEIGPSDKPGDEVILLGADADIGLPSIAASWGTSQQEVLVRLGLAGVRAYRDFQTSAHGVPPCEKSRVASSNE
jgi:alanine racemase